MCSVAASPGQKPADGPKMRVAVIDLEFKAGVYNYTSSQPPSDFRAGLTEKIADALRKTGKFIVLERQILDEIEQERHISTVAGKPPPIPIQPAQLLIKGVITEFSIGDKAAGIGIDINGLGRVNTRIAEARVKLNLRAIDPMSSEVLVSKDGDGKVTQTGARFDSNVSAVLQNIELFNSSPLGQATTKAINSAVKNFVKEASELPWSAKVIDLDDDGVYVNAGAKDGLAIGATLEVIRTKKVVKDPESGEVLGTEDGRVGVIRVKTTRSRYSIAVVTEGETPQVGDTVRILRSR
jgi:curli biogenesis system outer membrane secretion channel CsgG